MSNSKLSLKVLSSSVKSQNDVFDHLVAVQRLDTMETGLLLCSHCCRWPAALIPQATWLEGCYTPSNFANDSRLLMGNHPNSLTNWCYEETEEGVYIHLSVTSNNSVSDVIEVDGCMPYPYINNDNNMVNTRTYRHLSRIWRETNRTRNGADAVRVFYRTVFAMVDAGVLSELAVCSAINQLEGLNDLIQDLFINALGCHYNRLCSFYRYPFELYADGIVVVQTEPWLSCYEAVTPINTYEGGHRGGYSRSVVADDAIIWGIPGYAFAQPLVYIEHQTSKSLNEEEGWYVRAHLPELGFCSAVDLETFDAIVENGKQVGISVQTMDIQAGYAPAMPIVE